MSTPTPVATEDKWHVEVEPNEVKIVSLEQLDDLFRLSLVDSETKVWQAGMRDWQPLRVIAGLDEQPAPQPKRAPPKPPSPKRTAAPSVLPAPPAARSASVSVRPAPPAPRPAPPPAARPAYSAPASFYPQPIQAAPSAYPSPAAYAAPIAFAATVPATNSVRPLVVSQAPPIARGGGGFGRFLVALSLLAGVGVSAYRNDLLRDGAHAAHQDALYARFESALGGPAFGTVRGLEQSSASQPALEASSNDSIALRTGLTAPSATAPSTAAPALGTTTPPVVSLESLAPEKKGQAAVTPTAVTPTAVTPTAVTPTAVTRPTARAAASFVQSKPAAAPAKAPPAKAATHSKAAVGKPAPVAQKPASEMNERERLNAAIGQSMMQSAPPNSKGKAKAKASEYDPLNPTL